MMTGSAYAWKWSNSMLMCPVLLVPWSIPIVQKNIGHPYHFPPKESRVRLPVIFYGITVWAILAEIELPPAGLIYDPCWR